MLGESQEVLAEVPQDSNPGNEMDVEPTPVRWEGWDKFKKWPGKVPIEPVAKPMGQSLSRMIWVAPEPPAPDQPLAAAEATPASSRPEHAPVAPTEPSTEAAVATPAVASPPAAADTPDAPTEAAVAKLAVASPPATTETPDAPTEAAVATPSVASPPVAAETPDAPEAVATPAVASPAAPTERLDVPTEAAVATPAVASPPAPTEAAVAAPAVASPPAPTETPDALMREAAVTPAVASPPAPTAVATPAVASPPAPTAVATPAVASPPAAPTTAAPVAPVPPVALMESLQTPLKKQQSDSGGDVTFGPISQQAAKAWMVLLKRQSTDQLSPAPSAPSPVPETVPTPKPAPAPPTTIPAPENVPTPTAPVQPKANPTMQDDVSRRSWIVSCLMKMDDAQLEAKMDWVKADPSYKQFLAEVDQGPLNGATLPTLVAFDFWTFERSKISQQAPAVQQKPTPPEATPAVASPAHVPPSTLASHTPSPAPTSSLAESPAPASLAAEATDQEASAKEARACYMRYYRSVRSAKCPAPVAVKFREASADPTGKKLKALFAEYLECGENWLASSLVLTQTQSNSRTDGGRWGWLTRDDPLLKVMGGIQII